MANDMNPSEWRQLDLQRLILMLRTIDLRHRLGFDRPENTEAYKAWLVTCGSREYHALREDAAWCEELRAPGHSLKELTRLQELVYRGRPDAQQIFPLPQATDSYLHWFFAVAVAEHELWPFLTEREKSGALIASRHYGTPGLAQLEQWAAVEAAGFAKTDRSLPFGVNLIGHAFDQLGIGEDLRMTALALQAAKIPFAVVDFPAGGTAAKSDSDVAGQVVEEGPYAINLFCLTALEHCRFYAERGRRQFSGRYNIGYWPWELSQWPLEWTPAFDLVDEVWVSSTHIRDALMSAQSPSFDKPVTVMPLVVEVPSDAFHLREPGSRVLTRKRFGLPLAARLFCFSFDLNSSIHRKNPQAVADAFERAFPHDEYSAEQVGLVVKVQLPSRHHPAWEALKRLASSDGRIHIVEATLSRRDVLALYASCDCFVSLHRAEGFGRGLAEALQLGLHLIATDYSGNADFCRRPEFVDQVTLVPCRLVKVRPGQYPYAEGQLWANADTRFAAQAMKRFVKSAQGQVRVPAGGWPCFGAAELGATYGERLTAICRDRSPQRS